MEFKAADAERLPETVVATPPAPTSTALAVWTPPAEPTRWQRMSWAVLGRPEPGQDGRFDHVLIDASLVTVPSDKALARVVLDLASHGDLSVKSFYDALAAGTVTAKPKAIDALRKNLRIAAEKLDARSPGAKLAAAARNRVEILRRELDGLDALRADTARLAQRADGGASALLATYDGHHADLTTLLAGAATATGADADALEVVRASLAGLSTRRDNVQTSLGLQLVEIRSAQQERDAATARAAASERVAAREAAKAEETRVAEITNISPTARAALMRNVYRAESTGARFYLVGGAQIRSRDVLAHLALGSIDFAVGPAPTIRSMITDYLGYPWQPTERQSLRDLSALNALVERLGA